MTTLINMLVSEKGQLFTIGHGRRVRLACCKPEISIYEKVTKVPVLGKAGYAEKRMRFTVTLCRDMEFSHEVTDEALRKVERYELTADLMRNDGIVERFYFHNVSLEEINPEGEWKFEVDATREHMGKLLAMSEA